MEGHHGPLAEPDQRECGRREIVPFQFGVEKGVQDRSCCVDANPTFVRITKCERKPLATNWRLPTRAWCVRRYKCCGRQQTLPGTSNLNQIVSVGTIAVQKNHELTCGTRSRSEPRAVELSHSSFSFSWDSCRPVLLGRHSAEREPRHASLPHDSKPTGDALPRLAMAASPRPFTSTPLAPGS